MSFPRIGRAFCVVAGASAALAGEAPGSNDTQELDYPEKKAEFGGSGINGSLALKLSDQIGYQAVQWTTSVITIPEQLIRDTCGDFPDEQTFTYSINDNWLHWFQSSAHGATDCGTFFVGRRWDPTAACSKDSGNGACHISACPTASDYSCSPETFGPWPGSSGDFAYRFLNKDACELGDMSGMKGELQAVVDNETGGVAIPALDSESGGLAQMSAPFGEIGRESVYVSDGQIGLNCDSSGPPAVHATNCGCIQYNGKHNPSTGTLTVFVPPDHDTFFLGGPNLAKLDGKSIVIQCGSSFGDKAGQPLLCAKLG